MCKVHRVIVCGNTVALAGIETSLGLDPDCEVIGRSRLIESLELRELHPDVVIFELDDVPHEFIRSLSAELPNLLLIGIDLETNRAQLWSGQQMEGWSSQDLTQAIHKANFHIPG